MIVRWSWLVGVLLVAFLIGHTSGRPSNHDVTTGEVAIASGPGVGTSVASPMGGTLRSPRIDVPLTERTTRTTYDPPVALRREVEATIAEPADARELRHADEIAIMKRRDPTVSAQTMQAVLTTIDGVTAGNRRVRASFMLGEISEDDYTAEIQQDWRDGYTALTALMPAEQFKVVFQWNPTLDSFDPAGDLHDPGSDPTTDTTTKPKE